MIIRLRAGLLLSALFLFSLAAIPVQALALTKRGWLKRVLPRLWHRLAARALGLRVTVRGAPAKGRPLLLVSNHQSWADIVALGSVAEASFIAKAEVRGWPGIGILARLQRTVFVAREARRETGLQANAIADRLAAGDAMVLFAEGTTSDGNAVLPFKSALFGAAQGALAASGRGEVLVQPVSIAYTRSHGLPLGRAGRPLAAWPGDVALGPHLKSFVLNGAVDAEIAFAEPIVVTVETNRKALTSACEREVSRMLLASLRGTAGECHGNAACVEPSVSRY
ncbi:lysophospholipid acyltransferase family protein [Aureimonas mangrovi]|uniref:lysophospholipid acyltransferase family protein n=1 Tax=Aureimonas mangrovi TaxID=2758041 RepID=UPI001FE2A3E3|nr:lysophospholipid acyltransferase family protein [Aureimonas mangrovi]